MMTENTSARPDRTLLVVAFLTLYLVWGSTYLAIRFAVETMPPFMMAGLRFLLAGGILYAIVGFRQPLRPSWNHWQNAAVIGFAMFGAANGLVCWAERTVPSGLASLVIATTPLWMVTLETLVFRAARPSWRVLLGLGLGLIGVVVLIGPTAVPSERIDPLGAAALLVACFSWSAASLRSRTLDLPKSPFVTAAMQMLGGGGLLIVVSLLLGEWNDFRWQTITLKSWTAFAYLTVFGSILALSAYTWLLRVCPMSRVSTYAYVNPIVAVLLGTWLGKEQFSSRTGLASVVIVAAVVMIVGGRRIQVAAADADRQSCSADFTAANDGGVGGLPPETATAPEGSVGAAEPTAKPIIAVADSPDTQ